jgi:hypothetical protein
MKTIDITMDIQYCINLSIPINYIVIVWLSIGVLYMAWSVYEYGYFSLRFTLVYLIGIALGPVSILIGALRSYRMMKITRHVKSVLKKEFKINRIWK